MLPEGVARPARRAPREGADIGGRTAGGSRYGPSASGHRTGRPEEPEEPEENAMSSSDPNTPNDPYRKNPYDRPPG
ncbi:hypothetical protein, partial [Streptomyces barkulensis]|uniref:hypothetical protein n=1 Tax=Streptomyces barkulensis TaxID=1257026 RepID=UPI0019D03243